jgi:integrase
MATIKAYQSASGAKFYMVRYRQPNRKSTNKRGFTTKRDAQAFANTVEVDKLSGSYVAPALGMITVAELAPAWLARRESDVAQSHYRMLESAWRVHVEPVWGTTRIADIDLNAVESWIGRMGKPQVAPTAGKPAAGRKSGTTTIVRAYSVLAGILDDAVKSKRLASNPARTPENLPRRAPQRHVYLTAADVHILANESGQYRVLVLVLAFTGIRWGEAIALRVSDVEFLRRRLNVHSNAVQLGSQKYQVGPTKGRVARSVPVPSFVLDELSAQVKGRGPDALVFGDGERYLPRSKSNHGWFVGAVARAKVQRVTPHDLRHSCASLAISAGCNVLALSRMLGHTSAKITLDTYSDLFDTDLDAVAAAIDKNCAQSVPKRGSSRREERVK